jgi:septal ring factor EnvC (AmiA/AmiB activator)
LWLSRQRWQAKAHQLRDRLIESERETQQTKAELERARAEAERHAVRIAELEHANEKLQREKEQGWQVALPVDLPLPRHQYGPRMISLCVNLARRVGLRPAVAVLKIFQLAEC